MKEISHISDLQIAQCESIEEVQDALSVMASEANRSLSHALKAQLQVVKYISKPDLCGGAFDLFFKNLKKSIEYSEDEENMSDLREEAALMLNNFVFFMKSKIEWEVAVNRKEGENLFIEASNGLAQSILTLASMSYGGAAKAAIKAVAVDKLSKIFFNADEKGDNWFKKAFRWTFKSIRTAEKRREFLETLDRLGNKLIAQYDVIGKNNLIAGIYENYYDDLLESHSSEWHSYWSEADDFLNKSWQIPLYEVPIIGGIGAVVWLVRWIISWFTHPSSGWGEQQWLWTGIGGAIIVIGTALVFLGSYYINKAKGDKLYKLKREYYSSLIKQFRE